MFNVLIIDDDPHHEKLIKEVIYKSNLADIFCYGISDGDDAFHHLQSNYNYDLIIVDIYLHGVNGLNLVKYLNRNSNFAHTYIMVLSSSISNEEIRIAQSYGADAFCAKPISGKPEDFNSMKELINKVKKGKIKKGSPFVKCI